MFRLLYVIHHGRTNIFTPVFETAPIQVL